MSFLFYVISLKRSHQGAYILKSHDDATSRVPAQRTSVHLTDMAIKEHRIFDLEHKMQNLNLLLTFCPTLSSAEKMLWLLLRNLTSRGDRFQTVSLAIFLG